MMRNSELIDTIRQLQARIESLEEATENRLSGEAEGVMAVVVKADVRRGDEIIEDDEEENGNGDEDGGKDEGNKEDNRVYRVVRLAGPAKEGRAKQALTSRDVIPASRVVAPGGLPADGELVLAVHASGLWALSGGGGSSESGMIGDVVLEITARSVSWGVGQVRPYVPPGSSGGPWVPASDPVYVYNTFSQKIPAGTLIHAKRVRGQWFVDAVQCKPGSLAE